jgi:hypothetical protein
MIPVRTIASRTLLLARRPQAQAQAETSSFLHRKPFSSSSSSGSNGQQPVNPKERAQQLHNEIESIVKKHDQKHAEEIKHAKTFSGFLGEKNILLYLVNWMGVVV